MSQFDPDRLAVPVRSARFATTHWSLVAAAQDMTSPQAREALASLCSGYWYPLYAYIRRRGWEADQAQDLTQAFFARLLEKDFLAQVDRGKGKFRSFLLAACNHFLANERDRELAKKRGGGCQVISIELDSAEGKYGLEPAHNLTPEKLFDRRWALTLLDQVVARLKEEFAAAEKSTQFDRLKAFLTGEKGAVSYAQLAQELGTTEGAVKVAVHRLRRRYRELLREEIIRTVEDPGQVEEEISNLFTALGS